MLLEGLRQLKNPMTSSGLASRSTAVAALYFG
jgi:hypothetical protein